MIQRSNLPGHRKKSGFPDSGSAEKQAAGFFVAGLYVDLGKEIIMKKILLTILPLLLIVGCSKSVDKEKTNSEWFDYYNNTDLSIMNKLSEIMNRHEGYPTKEFCTNEDQLNTESRTGYKRDGSPGTNFTPQYWSKIIFSPNGNGKLLKGVRQNPLHSIEYSYDFEINWDIQLNTPSVSEIYKNNYISYMWEEKIDSEPINFIMSNFTIEDKIEFWVFVENVKYDFMSNNGYILNEIGEFEKNEQSWLNGKPNGEWIDCYNYSKSQDKCILKTFQYGQLLRDNGKIEESLIIYKLLIEQNFEKSLECQFTIGTIYDHNLKDYKNAIIEYRKVVENYPESTYVPSSMFQIGYIYSNYLGDYKNGQIEFTKFIEKFPNHDLAPSAKFELKNMGKELKDIPSLKHITG